MNQLKYLAVFAIGAAIGSAATIQFAKKHYEEIANEEIESVKEVFSRREEELSNITNEKVEKRAYEIITERYSHNKNDAETDKEEEVKHTMENRPYVIPPEEFGETGYKKVSLNYYDDGVLTNENDDVISDVDNVVGKDSLSKFGEYEPDSVYVRNEREKTDYEILADTRCYSDIYCIE